MGVTLYVSSYNKEPSCITGHIKCLGWYEVNLDKIYDHKLSKDLIDFRYGIHSFEALIASSCLTDFGLDLGDMAFYYKISAPYNGLNVRFENEETFGVMFEPQPLLKIVNIVLENINDINSSLIQEYDEEERLVIFKKVLEHAIENGGMIGMRYG